MVAIMRATLSQAQDYDLIKCWKPSGKARKKENQKKVNENVTTNLLSTAQNT